MTLNGQVARIRESFADGVSVWCLVEVGSGGGWWAVDENGEIAEMSDSDAMKFPTVAAARLFIKSFEIEPMSAPKWNHTYHYE